MATDTAALNSKKNYWQLPTFVVGLALVTAATIQFPPTPQDPTIRITEDAARLRTLLDRTPLDRALVEESTRTLASQTSARPEWKDAKVEFTLGSSYVRLAEENPNDQELWTNAEAHFARVEGSQLEVADLARLTFRRSKAQAALGLGDPNLIVQSLGVPPVGEESSGERQRLLAEALLRLTPSRPDLAVKEWTEYLSGRHHLAPQAVARCKLTLAESILNMKEEGRVEKARVWLNEIGPSAPPEVLASAKIVLAQLAVAEDNWAEAVKLYDEVRKNVAAPGETRALAAYQAGKGYLKLDKKADAVACWEQAARAGSPLGSAAQLRIAETKISDKASRPAAIELLTRLIQDRKSLESNPHFRPEDIRNAFEEIIRRAEADSSFEEALHAIEEYEPVATPRRAVELRAGLLQNWGLSLKSSDASRAVPKFRLAAEQYKLLAQSSDSVTAKALFLRRSADAAKAAGDESAALGALDALVALSGVSEDILSAAYVEKGEALLKGDRREEGIASLEKALTGSSAATARVKIALVRLDQAAAKAREGSEQATEEAKGLRAFARKLLVQAANGNPESDLEKESHRRALYELGKLLTLREGDYIEAETRFRQLLQTYPTGAYVDEAQLFLGCNLLMLARGAASDGRPPADADRKLEEARKLFESLSRSSDPFLRTQADVRLVNAVLLLKKHDEMPALCKNLAARYKGKVEELILLSMLHASYLLEDKIEAAAETAASMREAHDKLPDSEFTSAAEEYTRPYWKSWFDRVEKKR